MLYDDLKSLFPHVLEQLEMIWAKENLPAGVGRVGESHFTAISGIKDYSSNPHTDEGDQNYGFFIWLEANSTQDDGGNETRFYFPALGYYFELAIGDILLCKSNEIVHCSKTVGSIGQLGIALFQSCTFFQCYHLLEQKLRDGIKDRLTSSWLASERFYATD
ncbi:hypothetical protein M758_UG301000 [Ceratodon purpureus]|nr:hypothetical protein M758_UG301000 [Ceratodon purpureus]